jgi:hypothetical protein
MFCIHVNHCHISPCCVTVSDGLDGYMSDRQVDHNPVSDWKESHKSKDAPKIMSPGQYQGPGELICYKYSKQCNNVTRTI